MSDLTRIALAVCALMQALACSAEDEERGPEVVVQEFVERMQQLHGDPDDSRRAFDLLWAKAKQNLSERAKRASAVSGRQVAPEEMIAPSRFSLSFRPTQYRVTRVSGPWAEVVLRGDNEGQVSETVRCHREDGVWKVVVDLPQLPAIERRPGLSEIEAADL